MSGLPIMLNEPVRITAAGATLAGIAIFRDLAPDVVASLSRRCRWRRYGPGQTILQRHEDSRDVYFIVRGRACELRRAACGREVRFRDLPAGELCGEFTAIDGEPRSADVVAVTDTLMAIMSAELFHEVLRYESACTALLRRLTRAVRAAQQRVVELSTLPVRSRLQAELLRLAQTSRPDLSMAVIAPAPTHAEIASRIGTHREVVTRELGELARARMIERRGNALVVRDVAALTGMLETTSEGLYRAPCPAHPARYAA